MTTCIVVVNFNGWDDTRLCLHSLAKLTVPASVVLVDNASRENRLAEFQAEFPWCAMVANEENGGWAGGNNTGIRWAMECNFDQMLLLNNDTIVAPRLIEELLSAADANPEHGILGPVICFMDEPNVVMTDGCNFNHAGEGGFFQRKQVLLTGGLVDVEIVNGCALMVSAAVIRKIGLIDERFFLIHEESDFCLRAREAGFRCGVLGQALVWHKGSSSFARTGKKIQRYYDARNLYLLLEKHPTHPGRGRLASLTAYLRYVYHRYCHERENGNTDAANAVVEGLCDALAGRFGPLRSGSRWGCR